MTDGPYRTSGALVPQGHWRHPTWLENRHNGCCCADCPGDWTSTGVESARCNAPRPARWWRRLICRLRGKHKVVVQFGQASCTICLRVYEEPSRTLRKRRVAELEVGGDQVSVVARLEYEVTPTDKVVRLCPSGSYCATDLGYPGTACGSCIERHIPCPYVFEDPVDGTQKDLDHLFHCKRDHTHSAAAVRDQQLTECPNCGRAARGRSGRTIICGACRLKFQPWP